jgi:transcriptional regulator EpsA
MNRVMEVSPEVPESPEAPVVDGLSQQHAMALVRVIEAAASVRRRYQFFVWSQSYLQVLVPHHLLVCGSYQRARKDMIFEAFNCTPVPSPLLAAVTDGGSALMRQVVGCWIERRGRALTLDLNMLNGAAAGQERDRLVDEGFRDLLVHGVSRPQRPSELESLFIFAAQRKRCTAEQGSYLELLLPHVHSTWLRVQATERDLAAGHGAAPPSNVLARTRSPVTDREAQILYWVREGKSNQEIGDQLGISVLTVKNHVQKILRKLGASNRAQAVARAMSMNLLPAGEPERTRLDA